MRGIDLARQVQQGRARRHRFDDSAAGIPRRRAGAGYGDAEPAPHACIGIGHIYRPALGTRRHEIDIVATENSVQDRHVMDADNAESMVDAAAFKKDRSDIACGYQIRHCVPAPL